MKDGPDGQRSSAAVTGAGDPAFAKHGYEIETMVAMDSASDGEVAEFRLVDRRNDNRKARAFRYRVTNCRHMEQMLNWRWIRHPNVLRLVEYFIDAERRYAYCVCEILPKEDVVSRRLASSKNVKSRTMDGRSPGASGHQREDLCRRWTRECLTALAHAHHLHLYHNNFNWSNVYLDGHDNAKLADFRLLRYVPPSKLVYQPFQEDMQFSSPEALREGRMTAGELNKSELWSVGASLLKVLLNLNMAGATLDEEPSSDSSERQLRSHIGKNQSKLASVLKGSSDELLSHECRQFLEAILCPSHVADRPTVEEALLHPWLQSDRPVDFERLIENRYGTGTAQHEYVIDSVVVPTVAPPESEKESKTTISSVEVSISEETIGSEVSTLTVVDVEDQISDQVPPSKPIVVPTATEVPPPSSSEYVSTAAYTPEVSSQPSRGFANAAVQTDEIPQIGGVFDDREMTCPVETTTRTVYTETIVTRLDCHSQQSAPMGEPQFVTKSDDVGQLFKPSGSPTPTESEYSSTSPLSSSTATEYFTAEDTAGVLDVREEVDDRPPSSSTPTEYSIGAERPDDEGAIIVKEESESRKSFSEISTQSDVEAKTIELVEYNVPPRIVDVDVEEMKPSERLSVSSSLQPDVGEEVRPRTPRSSVGSVAQKKKSKVRPPSPWRFIREEEEEETDDYGSRVSPAPAPSLPTPQPTSPPIPPPTPSPQSLGSPYVPPSPAQSLPTLLPPPSPRPSLESHVSAHGEPDATEEAGAAQMPVIAVTCGGRNRLLRPRLEMRTTVQSVVDSENMPASMTDFDFVLESENAYKIPPIPALMTDMKCPPGSSPIVLVGRQHTHVEVFDPCDERERPGCYRAIVEDVFCE